MRLEHLTLLSCPRCRGALEARDASMESGRMREGILGCASCHRSYPVVRSIPRFLPDGDNPLSGLRTKGQNFILIAVGSRRE